VSRAAWRTCTPRSASTRRTSARRSSTGASTPGSERVLVDRSCKLRNPERKPSGKESAIATYAIGDVQGCFSELRALLAKCRFDPQRDRLWFVGDLVNRGPDSLAVLRYVRALGRRAIVVLGNHDLHLIALYEGLAKRRRDDTLEQVLAAPDAKQLVDWLRARPLLHAASGWTMVHAGLLPQWGLRKARALAREVEAALTARRYRDFLANMYGSEPGTWSERLAGWDRLRVIVNTMTRLRFCSPQGRMDLRAKDTVAPQGMRAWFELRPRRERTMLVCGHWSTLGLKLAPRLAALDSGCVWGGSLSALRLEDRALFQAPCRRWRTPAG
jgi:bis(5'-nucleosyl)-tetraphosphatase (symmetrical)